MVRKRRRSRGRTEDEVLVETDEQETAIEGEEADEKPAVSAPKKEAVAQKTAVKAPPPKPVARKGPVLGRTFINFLKDVKAEMKKVSWPDKERTTQSTLVVIFTLLLLAAIMALYTVLFTKIAEFFFGAGTGLKFKM